MKQCDNASAGVLIERSPSPGHPRWLMTWRANFPHGVAPVAGHVFDEHKSYEDAAAAEVKEETGLDVTWLHPTGVGGWQPNRCRRKPGKLGTGHQWMVYTASVEGELSPSAREVKKARWLSRPEVQLLANRTVMYARGRICEAEFEDCPGIEPVWVGFLAQLDVIRVPAADMALTSGLAAEGGNGALPG